MINFFRAVARKFQEFQHFSASLKLFEKIVKLKGEEPQSVRDFALALAETKDPNQMRKALVLLVEILKETKWDVRFSQIGKLIG